MENRNIINDLAKSFLIFKVESIAQSVFDIWCAKVKEHHAGYSFNEKKDKLVKDILHSFSAGIIALNQERYNEKPIGWSIGFLKGFVSSNLATHWYGEYVFPQSESYKEIMALKSVISYLDFDNETVSKLYNIHNHYLKKDQHNEVVSIDIEENTDNILFINKYRDGNYAEVTEFKSFLHKYLTGLLAEEVEKKWMNREDSEKYYSLSIEPYFENSDMQKLIDIYCYEPRRLP